MDEIKKAKADAIEIIEAMIRLPKQDQIYLLGIAKGLEAARKNSFEPKTA